jgi:CRP-like cAMP-binding protein
MCLYAPCILPHHTFFPCSVQELFRLRLEKIDTFCALHNIPYEMEERMEGYITYLWQHTKVMRNGIKQNDVLADMPSTMCSSVLMFLYGHDVKQVPIFAGLEDGFIKQLVTHLEDCVCLANDFVFVMGDIGTTMFFIRDGKARVLADAPRENARLESVARLVQSQPLKTLAILMRGSFFGEISLITNFKRTASVQAMTNMEMFSLQKNVLDELMELFPGYKEIIMKSANRRLHRSNTVNLAIDRLKAMTTRGSHIVVDGHEQEGKDGQLEIAVETAGTDNAEVVKASQDSLSKPVKSPYQNHLSPLDLKQRHHQLKAVGAEAARTTELLSLQEIPNCQMNHRATLKRDPFPLTSTSPASSTVMPEEGGLKVEADDTGTHRKRSWKETAFVEERHSIHKALPPRIGGTSFSMTKNSSFNEGRGSFISNPTTVLMMNATTARERVRRDTVTRDTGFAINPSNSFQEVEMPLESESNQAIHKMQEMIQQVRVPSLSLSFQTRTPLVRSPPVCALHKHAVFYPRVKTSLGERP